MVEQHARTGIAHHRLDALFHFGLVAMNGTAPAGGFPFAEGAMGQPGVGIAQQLLAIGAQRRIAFFVAAIDFNHLSNGFLFALDGSRTFSFSFLHFPLDFV